MPAKRRDPKILMEELKKLDLNTLVISSEVYWAPEHNQAHVLLTCSACGVKREAAVSATLRGDIKRCNCQPKQRVDARTSKLNVKYRSILDRCCNENHPSYKDYGGRGIKNKFTSKKEFVSWMLENLPHDTYEGVEVDRINNEGHYEPGNIRLVSRVINVCNRRDTRLITYRGVEVVAFHLWDLIKADYPDYPLSKVVVFKLALKGVSAEDIVKHRRARLSGRPSNPKLKADPKIVALYRDRDKNGWLTKEQGVYL